MLRMATAARDTSEEASKAGPSCAKGPASLHATLRVCRDVQGEGVHRVRTGRHEPMGQASFTLHYFGAEIKSQACATRAAFWAFDELPRG